MGMGWKSVAAALVVTYGDCSGKQPIFAIWFLPTRKFKRQVATMVGTSYPFSPHAPNVSTQPRTLEGVFHINSLVKETLSNLQITCLFHSMLF